MEKLAIVCPVRGTETGTVLSRAEAIATGAWCRSTSVFLLNHFGEILVHQRSLTKERFPGVWSTHLGGHVATDETYETNAYKEVAEEAGLSMPAGSLVPWRTTRLNSARLWIREYVGVIDAPIELLVPQPGEVERFRFMSPEAIVEAAQHTPEAWCAGTHDFLTEYHCLRAALSTAHAYGHEQVPETFQAWQPVRI